MNNQTILIPAGIPLVFDMPSSGRLQVGKPEEEGSSRRPGLKRFLMNVDAFHRKWHTGTSHARTKKGRYPVGTLEDRDYTTQELATVLGMHGHQTVVLMCRGGAPHRRGSDGRRLLINGRQFAAWYLDPPVVSYSQRTRLKAMHVRCIAQTGGTNEITHTHITEIEPARKQDCYRVTLSNGIVSIVALHQPLLTSSGWLSLAEGAGVQRNAEGLVSWHADSPQLACNGEPAHTDPEWLRACRAQRMSAQDMADVAGVTYDRVKYQLRKHGIKLDKEFDHPRRRGTPWNKGRTYKNPKAGLHLKGRPGRHRGADHHWWKGGTTPERKRIGAWTQTVAWDIHASNDFRCVICKSQRELRAHHVVPVSMDPSRGRDATNLTTLCQDCHVKLHSRNLEAKFIAAFHAGATQDFWQDQGDAHETKPLWKGPSKPLLTARMQQIVDVTYAGYLPCYAIRVDTPLMNVVADRLVLGFPERGEIDG